MGYGAVWYGLVAVRLAWSLLPQHGYIHPDEFFQTTEVVAGDVLGIEVNCPWEFNKDWPIRSIALPYTILGPPLHALKYLGLAGYFKGAFSIPTYWLLVVPRLTMAILSICVDLLVGKIAHNLKINAKSSVLTIATSHVTFVHLTRTFTNTFETLIFTVLLYFCTKQQRGPRHYESLSNMALSLAVVTGFFNRPTFLAFAFVPLMSWCYNSGLTLRKILQCTLFGLISVTVFVLADTVYFRGVTLHELYNELLSQQLTINTTRITPYAWLLYNSHPNNLANHGLHPRYTHIFVYLPMLFGPCALIIYGSALVMIKNKCSDPRGLLVATVLCPVAVLSLAPHQEVRFLLPLLPSVALICGPVVFGKKFRWRLLRVVWIIFNILGAIVFGVLHQGGVTKSLSVIQSRVNQEIVDTGRYTIPGDIVFFHTYMPPNHLLAKPVPGVNPTVTDSFQIHDLMGASVQELEVFISKRGKDGNTDGVILVTPATVLQELCKETSLKFKVLETVWPHVSFEDLPSQKALFSQSWYLGDQCVQIPGSFIERIHESLSMKILQLQ